MARLLLIDDDDEFRTLLRLTLVHHGHRVCEARNGEEGLAQYALAAPDLVITDIVMPEMEGLDLVMELRKRQPTVKIIAISGGGQIGPDDYLHCASLLGAAVVLSKPFPALTLLAAIDGLLQNDTIAADVPSQVPG